MNKTLDVYWEDRLVGELAVDDFDRYRFTYAGVWLQSPSVRAIGHVLPLQETPHEGHQVHNFFANLLPEGRVRERLERHLHTGHSDFALLWELGRDVAGVLSLVPHGTPLDDVAPAYCQVNRKELKQRLKMLDRMPFLKPEERCSLSLAGAQNKLNVLRRGNRFCFPLHGAPTNCIIKIAARDFADIVFNEYLCMSIAAAVGLPCPAVSLLKLDGMRALAVERYDRIVNGDGSISRIHQQDFCQLLGLSHEDKYEYWGGPSLKQCADVLGRVSSMPVVDTELLGKWYTFNLLIGNMDGHAKNIAVLLTPGGWRLAPFYDIVHTLSYAGLRDAPAMHLSGGEVPLRDLTRQAWLNTMETIGLKRARSIAWMKELCSSTMEACGRIRVRGLSGEEERIVGELASSIRATVEFVAARLKVGLGE